MLDLSKPWRDYPLISIDFETTGTDPQTCEPVEVAAVRFENGQIVGRFSSLLRTCMPIPAEATAVHGITDEMVLGAPGHEDVFPKMLALADGAVPLAFNRTFDRTIAHRYLTTDLVPAFDPAQAWLCTYAMAWACDRYEPGKGRLKLSECCKRRGINVVGAHRAEADAIASGMLFHHIMAGEKVPCMAAVLARVDKCEREREADWAAFQKKLRAAERTAWRQYACAALASGLTDRDGSACWADEMIALEKERFE